MPCSDLHRNGFKQARLGFLIVARAALFVAPSPMPFFSLKYGNHTIEQYCIDCGTTGLLGYLGRKLLPVLRQYVDENMKRVEKEITALDVEVVPVEEGGGDGDGDGDGDDGDLEAAAAAAMAANKGIQDLEDLKQLKAEQKAALEEAAGKLDGVVSVILSEDDGTVVLDRTSEERAKGLLTPKRTYVLTGERRAGPEGEGEEGEMERVNLTFAVPPDDGPSIASVLGSVQVVTKGSKSGNSPGHRRTASERPAGGGDGDGENGEGSFPAKSAGHKRSQTAK